ncbi:nitroreductase family protein [Nocardia sp. NPDC050378]|uniref:nitroreductase family protein n=1 Tax=Nocardia sp. NPDC050378 TaxID=3155400 RepID=UPI00340615C0
MHSIAPAPMAWTDLVEPRTPHIARREPLTGRVAGVVARIEAVIGRDGAGSLRRVPSAGAAYPYEIVLVPPGSESVVLVDLARRQVLVRAGDTFDADADSYPCLLVGRPWLSMRKYGPRGYLYHLIDSGHAIFDLGLLSVADPPAAAAALPDPSGAVIGDVLAAGQIAAGTPHTSAGWRLVTTVDARVQAGRTAFEKWATRISPPAPSHPVRFDRVRQLPGLAQRTIAARRSAASFRPGADGDLLDRVVGTGLRYAESMLEQLDLPWPGVHVVGCGGRAVASPPEDLLTALAGQDHLLDAQTFVVIGAPTRGDDSIDHRRQGLLIAAGVVGQALYLAATEMGAAVTGVGGIEPGAWNRLLPAGQQALYLIALGRSGDGEKFDALYPGSHG